MMPEQAAKQANIEKCAREHRDEGMDDRLAAGIALAGAASLAAPASAKDVKICLLAGKTGPLEAYAKQTETGFMLGLEYPTGGKMEMGGRKIR